MRSTDRITRSPLCKDNGIGILADMDWRNAKSLGLRLVAGLVQQLQGTVELDRTAGTTFTIVVKEKNDPEMSIRRPPIESFFPKYYENETEFFLKKHLLESTLTFGIGGLAGGEINRNFSKRKSCSHQSC